MVNFVSVKSPHAHCTQESMAELCAFFFLRAMRLWAEVTMGH